MLPASLALVDDDPEYLDYLAQFLREAGIEVTAFADSDDLLVHPQAYAFGFYVLDLMLPGVDGVQLIRVLRKRTDSGILVVSGRLAPDVFEQVIEAGADMYLAKPVRFEQVRLAIEAVQRRVAPRGAARGDWLLDVRGRQLHAPDGVRIDLNASDLALLECLAAAHGEPVARETLLQRLGRDVEPGPNDGLNGIVFRLRRRIEQATPLNVPIETRSRVGYVFRGGLRRV